MRSGKVISGTVIDLQNVLDIDGGNAFLLHDGIGNRYVIGKIAPGELNLRDHIRSKGYECRSP